MGKVKGKGDEHACRINYLFQAGQLVAKDAPGLSRYYGQVLTVITEKTAPKKDFTMKRSMCKKCHSVLKIGENATYRVRKNKHRKGTPNIVIGCMMCGERKCLPTGRNYQLKAEQEGKIMQNGADLLSYQATPPNGIANKNGKSPTEVPGETSSSSATELLKSSELYE